MKPNCESRTLRIWMKAFIEMMPTIIKEYKDAELVDLLLFQLPWLCYGFGNEYRINSAGQVVLKNESQSKGVNDNSSIGKSNLSGSLIGTSVVSVPVSSEANLSHEGGKQIETSQINISNGQGLKSKAV